MDIEESKAWTFRQTRAAQLSRRMCSECRFQARKVEASIIQQLGRTEIIWHYHRVPRSKWLKRCLSLRIIQIQVKRPSMSIKRPSQSSWPRCRARHIAYLQLDNKCIAHETQMITSPQSSLPTNRWWWRSRRTRQVITCAVYSERISRSNSTRFWAAMK